MSTTDDKKLFSWMKKRFMPERTKGWDSTIHVRLSDGEPFTVDVNRRAMRISDGLVNEPLAQIQTGRDTLLEILRGDVPLDLAIMKGELSADNMVEVFKFITVFEPVIKHAKVSPGNKPRTTPKTKVKNASRK